MPQKIRKVKGKACYSVKNSETGKVHSKCTTLAKAQGQRRIIEKADLVAGSHRAMDFLENIPRRYL